jgi:predicted ATPase
MGPHSNLHEYLQLVRSGIRPRDGYFLRAESFYNGGRRVRGSGGLWGQYPAPSVAWRIVHGPGADRLKGKGLYLFDEPESALSPTRQLSLMVAMQDLVNRGSQFIIATHSPILLAYRVRRF